MPGPFPGMDPYLEHPALWPDLHQSFMTFARSALNASLPPGYVARINERVYVIPPERSLYPDMIVLQRPRRRQPTQQPSAGVATVAATEPTGIVHLLPEERHEAFIEIRRPGVSGEVVTVVELLSPANKAAGNQGRELYLQKQRGVLQSPVNLVEIDLLRAGEHTVAAPRERLLDYGGWDYLVVSRRGGPTGYWEFWAIRLREPLPRIGVPLAGDDPDVVLDLQAVLDRCYDDARYDLDIDYREEAVPPLAGEEAAWADALLRERGLRGEPVPGPVGSTGPLDASRPPPAGASTPGDAPGASGPDG